MAKFEDLSGKRFGKWTVIERADNNSCGSARWICKCDCGTIAIKPGESVKKSKQGCRKCYVSPRKKHGGKGSRLYECWRHMRYRCDNKSNQAYPMYGGRGIKVCAEWYDFGKFQEWALENGYSDNLTLDRIDVNGNYEPKNCRWADAVVQMNNRRSTPHYTLGDKSLTISEWARETGIPRSTILNRLKRGWSFKDAVEKGDYKCQNN